MKRITDSNKTYFLLDDKIIEFFNLRLFLFKKNNQVLPAYRVSTSSSYYPSNGGIYDLHIDSSLRKNYFIKNQIIDASDSFKNNERYKLLKLINIINTRIKTTPANTKIGDYKNVFILPGLQGSMLNIKNLIQDYNKNNSNKKLKVVKTYAEADLVVSNQICTYNSEYEYTCKLNNNNIIYRVSTLHTLKSFDYGRESIKYINPTTSSVICKKYLGSNLKING